MASVDTAAFLISTMTKKLRRIRDVFALIGIAYSSQLALRIAWNALAGFRAHIWSRLVEVDFRHYGRWAVVTGCTDGIGNAYCHSLAKRGMDVILVSRSLKKLRDTAKELESLYGVQTHVVQADFSYGKPVFEGIAAQLRDKDIGVLVNNVGVMYEYPMMFEEVSEETLWQHILLNVSAVTMMTHIVLPGMVQRGRGAIINLSSCSAIYPLPLMAVYSASKAYVDYFTRCLQHEYRGSGIEIQCIMPFYVSTAMTRFSGILQQLRLFVPDAPTFVSHALRTLGHSKRTTGYWSHGIQYAIFGSVPEWVWLHCGYWMQKFLRHDADSKKRKMLALESQSGSQ